MFIALAILLHVHLSVHLQAQDTTRSGALCHIEEQHAARGGGRTILHVAVTSTLQRTEDRRAAVDALASEMEADSIHCIILFLYADARLVRTSFIEYQVSLARDGLGLLGASGIDNPPPFTRETAIPIRAYREDEIRVAACWQAATLLYPNPDMLSSLSYDRDAVRKHVARELGLNARTLLQPTPVPLKRSRMPATK